MHRLAALLGFAVGGCLLVVTPVARADDVGAAQARANGAARAESAAETKLAEFQGKAATLQRQAAATKAQLDRLTATARRAMVARYVNAHNTRLFDGTDLNRQVQVDALATFVTGGDQGAVDRYVALAQDLASAQAAAAAALAAERKAVANLRTTRAALEAQLAHLVALQKAAAARQAASARAPAPKPGRPGGVIATGAWVCPVQGPHSFSDDFGAPRSGGRSHQGNDIFAARGTPVVSPVEANVVDRSNTLGGLAVHITGVDGNFYYGAHLEAYAASGHVAAGTVIGYVGNTGDAAGGPTHLHFEIHPHGGAAIDPYQTLIKFC